MSELPAMTFGQFIRKRRKELGCNVSEMAEKAQTNPASIRQWEADECRPFVSSLKKIAKAYEVLFDDLVQFDLRYKPKSNPPIRRLKMEIKACRKAVLNAMTGGSQFEANLRGMVLQAFDQCDLALEPVMFLDSAF